MCASVYGILMYVKKHLIMILKMYIYIYMYTCLILCSPGQLDALYVALVGLKSMAILLCQPLGCWDCRRVPSQPRRFVFIYQCFSTRLSDLLTLPTTPLNYHSKSLQILQNLANSAKEQKSSMIPQDSQEIITWRIESVTMNLFSIYDFLETQINS